jgi:UDP-N-acetylmuramate: L-alanyl-gamma-D-glutamyl-meso-diaminopimelate ligase
MKHSKWIHIIGIGGITTSAVALEFKKKGWKVTGSDPGIHYPTDKELETNGIIVYPEFSYENLVEGDLFPDIVLLGSSTLKGNKEYLFAKKQKLPIKTYPEILESEVVVYDNSIVVAGTYGKTSLSAMLIYLFEKCKKNISYMYGGISDSIESRVRFKNESTEYSIIEGDEYINSRIDPKSKFFFYHPKYLILNSVEWDHTDFFKTEEEYFANFKNLIKIVPENGIIFASKTEVIRTLLETASCKIIWLEGGEKIETNLLGKFNKENLSKAYEIGVGIGLDYDLKNILSKFQGIKRRLETRFKNDKYKVIDDFGSSPAKAAKTIDTLNNEFPDHKLVIVYEPNEGARTDESIGLYKGLFDDAEVVYFPEFREMKNRINAENLKSKINSSNIVVTSREKLVSKVVNSLEIDSKYVVAFLSSHSFEKEILDLIKELNG